MSPITFTLVFGLYVVHGVIAVLYDAYDGFDFNHSKGLTAGAITTRDLISLALPWVDSSYFASIVRFLVWDIEPLRGGFGLLYRGLVLLPLSIGVGWGFLQVVLPTFAGASGGVFGLFRRAV